MAMVVMTLIIFYDSFDYPGDTLIPCMKLVRYKITGFNWHLTPWKSPQDPSQGHYPYQLGPYEYHELILREGSVIKYRTAPWNGIQFSGMHNLNPTYDFVLDNDDEGYYGYKLLNSSTLFRLALTQDGFGLSYIGSDGNQGWVVYLIAMTDICDTYGICGPNGACSIDKSPVRKNQQQKYGELKPGQKEDMELPLFNLAAVVCATKNFSNNNKLGEGGFGSVFKGTLKDGQEIDAKTLSKHSRQGLNELKNEGTPVRSIHVGLLSVQRNLADRPSMPAAVVMLNGEGSLPQPQKPGFYSEWDLNQLEVDPSP
ncbi:unnamed protein product [Prunus armeniaca]